MAKFFSFFFTFTRQQRRGVLALLLFMVLFQIGYFVISSITFGSGNEVTPEEKQWLALQQTINVASRKTKDKQVLHPFNPNYISDYKGYLLGMSVEEIDRLHKFRNTGKYLNSAADFQKVTKVPDSLLAEMSPYFKFPDLVRKAGQQEAAAAKYVYKPEKGRHIVHLQDINEALEEDLVKVYGIGPVMAKQILRRRAQLGAFVSMDQLAEFPKLSPDAVQNLKSAFTVKGIPAVEKININTASLSQLTYFPYFNKGLAKAIITRRSMDGRIKSIEELLEINDFPVDKQKIIALYLDF